MGDASHRLFNEYAGYMNLKILPVQRIRATIDLPASKSYSIRAFFVALCGGESQIVGASDCDDAKVAMRVARVLGARVIKKGQAFVVDAQGIGKHGRAVVVPVGESGTSLRFVLPLLPFFTARARVTGRGTLIGRPNRHLCQALRESGLSIRGRGSRESVPIIYDGGDLSGAMITIDGSVSSQFISALMIAAVRSRKETRLHMKGQLVSRDYITMTRQILKRAGINTAWVSSRDIVIPGGQKISGLKKFHVPSDYGLAAFWMVAAALVRSDISLSGYFDDRLLQSDGAVVTLLRKMGMEMKKTSRRLFVRGPVALKGGTFSLKDCPDLVPIMTVAAMFAKGKTRLKNIGHARVKESDRISDLRRELIKVGADIEEKTDELVICPCPSYGRIKGRNAPVLDSHGDHRLAMAFAVLGLRVPLIVKDIGCCSKSYPGFTREIRRILSAAGR